MRGLLKDATRSVNDGIAAPKLPQQQTKISFDDAFDDFDIDKNYKSAGNQTVNNPREPVLDYMGYTADNSSLKPGSKIAPTIAKEASLHNHREFAVGLFDKLEDFSNLRSIIPPELISFMDYENFKN